MWRVIVWVVIVEVCVGVLFYGSCGVVAVSLKKIPFLEFKRIFSVEEGIVMVGGELWRVVELYNYCVVGRWGEGG